MAAKKQKADVKLSEELAQVAQKLVDASVKSGSITEDDIQVALRDIDIEDDELSDLYDAVRARGVEVTTAGDSEAAGSLMDVLGAADDDDASVFDAGL